MYLDLHFALTLTSIVFVVCLAIGGFEIDFGAGGAEHANSASHLPTKST